MSCHFIPLDFLFLCHIWNRTNAQYPHWRLSGTNISRTSRTTAARAGLRGPRSTRLRTYQNMSLHQSQKKHIKKQCENRIVRELDSMMIINVMIFSHVFPIWFSEIARSDFSLGSRWSRADLSVPQQPFLQVNSTAAIHVHAWWSIHHDSQSWCHLMST